MRVGWVIVLCALGCAGGERVPSAPLPLTQPSSSGRPPSAPPPRVTVDSDGRATLVVGQELEVRLEGNVTTGYAWGLVVPVPDILAVVDPGTYRARPDTEGREGAGGTTTFVLRAVHLGTGALELVYGRPWERGVAAARTLRVDVDVR